jgi:hypothetical protein
MFERVQPEGCNECLEREHAAVKKAEHDADHTACDQQPQCGIAAAENQSDGEQHGAVADIAKHVAEHERRHDGDDAGRIGLACAGYPEHAGKKLERPHPAGVREELWRFEARRRLREPEEALDAGIGEQPEQGFFVGEARPAAEPGEVLG